MFPSPPPPPPAPREPAHTGGLPALVRTLHYESEEGRKNPNADPPSSNVWLMGFLHCLVLVLLIVSTVTSNEARDFRDAATFLPHGGVLANEFLVLSVINIVLYALFVLLSALDAAWFLATQTMITGFGTGFGFASNMLTAGLTVIASLQVKSSVFWTYLIALVSANAVLALQLATILGLLIKGDGPLLRAIRLSV